MSFEKPTLMERFGLGWLTHNCLGGFYRKYIDTLGIREDARVLDFGSGSGMCSKYILRKLDPDHGELTCLEPSSYWLEYAKRRIGHHRNVFFKNGRITDNTLLNHYYDIVNIHLVLHDIQKGIRQETISALYKHLNSGGVVYVREPTGSHHGMPVEDIRDLFKNAGFNLVEGREGKIAMMGKGYRAMFKK